VTDEELEALLDDLEAALLADVTAALALTAQDFADALDGATELVAARFSVSRIRDMWRRRVGGIMDRLRSISGRAAEVAADDAGTDLPNDWDENLAPYLKATRALLDAVGDRLASEASQSLAEGLNAGEDLDQLKARLAAVFAQEGTQLGAGRAQRIAMTEATRAFNAGTLAAAQAMTGPDRPLVKQWITRNDARVRDAHRETNGQLQLLDDPFDVDGTPMQYPGDPTAPAALTVNCRCIMRTAVAEGNRDMDQEVTASDADGQTFQSNMPAQLKRYWLTGEGAAKIRWGTPGSFDRCVRALRDDFPENTEGLCANLHHEATGKWPRENSSGADVHTGAMIALMPTVEDAERMALEGGEAAEQLHLTLYYLGDAADWTTEQQGDLISRVAAAARYLKPVPARAFGGAQWNPASDEPAWVWNVGDDLDADGSRLMDAKYEITYALEDGHNDPDLPQQYTPWSPHVCAAYGQTADALKRMAERTGPVTFDRVRVAFAGQYTDIPLSGAAIGTLADVDYVDPEPVEPIEYEQPPQLLTWSTPGATALAFENQQTGDGRVFAPGALYWSRGPWPLQYADEMNGGHEGARLAGAIFDMARDGQRVAGAGVLYLTQQAGVEAALLLSQGAPLGVSVDLDDVDVEMVDATGNGPQTPADGVYTAHLVTASLLPLPDGGWRLTGETDERWTASASGTVGETSRVDIVMGPDGRVPAAAFEITAAAGDGDAVDGVVVDAQRSGEYLMRITKARVRGATLVSIPAYADARIVLDDPTLFAAVSPDQVTAAAAASNYDRVVRHVRKSLIPVTAADAATFLRLPISDVRRYLARAAKKGTIVRIAHGRYVAPTETTATAVAAAATDGDELTAALEVAGDELSQVEPDDVREEMEASAWSAVRDLPPMPAAWFAAPTDEELPPGGPGVNYRDGRIFGWVAQAGEPHAGFAKKVTIDGLGKIDTSHFLRQRFTLDDGSTVKVGAFTMNVGHHRDGAECETSACQFDDSRTVAGIVTVGMSDRGMWFSGAAAPWISEWDRSVFLATQPSYHMKKGPSGNWQLRAVLSVPVPGHSSPLLASAVVDRSNLALTAAATMVDVEEAVAAAQAADELTQHDQASGHYPHQAPLIDYDRLADSLVAAMSRAEQKKLDEQAELEALLAEGRKLDADTGTVEGD
jgi:2'-5' RNA ligase